MNTDRTIVLVTFEGLGRSLVAAAEQIVGAKGRVLVIEVPWDADSSRFKQKLEEEIPRERELILLTDMYGATPTNLVKDLRLQCPHAIVTGVNLPMVIKTVTLSAEIPLRSAADQLRDQAAKAIQVLNIT